MNTTTSTVLAALITIGGRWATKSAVSIRVVIGMMMLALILAVVGTVNAKFAQQLGVLVLVAALFLPPDVWEKGTGATDSPAIISIVKGLGLAK